MLLSPHLDFVGVEAANVDDDGDPVATKASCKR